MKRLLMATWIAGWLAVGAVWAQGPITPGANLGVRADDGALMLLGVAPAGVPSNITPLANLGLRATNGAMHALISGVTSGLEFTPDGDCSAPPITFDGDEDTGIDRTLANILSICVGGSSRADFSTAVAAINIPVRLGSAADYFGWISRSRIYSPADGAIAVLNAAEDGVAYVRLGPATAAGYRIVPHATLGFQFRNGNDSASVPVSASDAYIGGTLAFSGTAPTVASGFGTDAAIASGRTAAFTINVGTGGVASSGVITLPAAPTGWVVECVDITNAATAVPVQTAGTTTSATISNFARTTGLLTAWAASDILRCTATGY